jgi:FAD/FMN-containing dehydrogenase
MAQWASHGDLDMNKQEVWEKYFDKPETYHMLRRIKRDVDPDDVFHSRFTLRPEGA